MAFYLFAFSMGFLGSMHCIGMCGGLVSALSLSQPKIWWPGLMSYQLGRVITYSLLGLLAGTIGISIAAVGWFGNLQWLLAAFAGVVMVLFGMQMAGVMRDPLIRLTAAVARTTGLSRLIRHTAGSPMPVNWLAVGMVNGLLPCGLVYAALAMALAAEGPLDAALGMAFFGLGTVPAMSAVPVALRAMTPERRSWLMRLLGIAVILLGLLTMVRGTSLMHALHGGGHNGAHGTMQHDGAQPAPATPDHSMHQH